MTEDVSIRDLDDIQRRGMTGVMIEAGYGMSAPDLSPGWFELVRFAVEQARQRNRRVWLVDEGQYPSGFAGGKFSAERPDLRMQGLVVAERSRFSGAQQRAQPNPKEHRPIFPPAVSGRRSCASSAYHCLLCMVFYLSLCIVQYIHDEH